MLGQVQSKPLNFAENGIFTGLSQWQFL